MAQGNSTPRTPSRTRRRRQQSVAGKKKQPSNKRKREVQHEPAHSFIQHAFDTRVQFIGGGQPAVLLAPEAYSRMWHFVDIATTEVGWLGTVRRLHPSVFLVEEVFLVSQEASTTHNELSTEGQAELACELLTARPNEPDILDRIRFWGHSHVNMGTNPSPQDNDQMEAFRQNGCPWFIRAILNKKGRVECTLFLWDAGIIIADVPWGIHIPVDHSPREEFEAEFAQKVTELQTYTVQHHVNGLGHIGYWVPEFLHEDPNDPTEEEGYVD